jgi:transketolase
MRKAALSTIESLLDENQNIVFIGSDLGQGTLAKAKIRHPKRVFMEGISEQHLIGFAAGLALEGFIPFVHTIGTFLTRRALEQIIVDVALQNLSVKLIASGGGMVYAPLGPTHQSIDDFALMRSIPNMVIAAPADPLEMTDVVTQISNLPGPAYVRVAKGGEPIITSNLPKLEFGKIRPITDGNDVAILTTGVMLHECLDATKILNDKNIDPAIYHFTYIAPIEHGYLIDILRRFRIIFTVEEHLPNGGLFSAISEVIVRNHLTTRVYQLSLPNSYAEKYGTQKEHWKMAGLDGSAIAEFIRIKS